MTPNRSVRSVSVILVLLLCIVLFPLQTLATPEYAGRTGFACTQCHVDAIGGGELTAAGKNFVQDLKAQGQYRPLSIFQRVARLIVGYVHMLAAIAWFGTIMYVHILLKPAYASKGLPRGELKLGWLSMVMLLISGVLLTIARVPSLHVLYTTRFGILLSIKIFLFLIMFSSAVVVTLFIGPKLRRQRAGAGALQFELCSLDELSRFDGQEGRPAYFAYQGTVYDATKSKLWKNGSHVMKHAAGNDLTTVLPTAPHGEEKILSLPRVGTLRATDGEMTQPFPVRVFYFFAYMNLILVFVITFVIALWRWW
jgi:predicted heme/steroid binding protein/uncharacterized membrane protein